MKKQFDRDGINENAEEKAARAKGVGAHLSKYNKIEAELVLPGEIVGYVGASGNHELSYWENPHLHITYCDLKYTNKISIEINKTSEIVFSKNSYTTLISERKNPFVHDSEDRKPKKDLKGNIVQWDVR